MRAEQIQAILVLAGFAVWLFGGLWVGRKIGLW
jgi:hypothetical protein